MDEKPRVTAATSGLTELRRRLHSHRTALMPLPIEIGQICRAGPFHRVVEGLPSTAGGT